MDGCSVGYGSSVVTHRRRRGNVGIVGIDCLRVSRDPGSLPCPSGAKPECQLGDEAPSRNVVVNYAINPTSNNIKLVFTPITPTGKLFSDLSALEAKIFPLISSLN